MASALSLDCRIRFCRVNRMAARRATRQARASGASPAPALVCRPSSPRAGAEMDAQQPGFGAGGPRLPVPGTMARAAVHGDAHARVAKHAGKARAGELAAPVGAEDLRRLMARHAASSASMQKPACSVFDTGQAKIFRVAQSMTATRWRTPSRISSQAMSAHQNQVRRALALRRTWKADRLPRMDECAVGQPRGSATPTATVRRAIQAGPESLRALASGGLLFARPALGTAATAPLALARRRAPARSLRRLLVVFARERPRALRRHGPRITKVCLLLTFDESALRAMT